MGNDVKINIVAQDSTAPGLSSVENNIKAVETETAKSVSLLDQLKNKLNDTGNAGAAGFKSLTSSASSSTGVLDVLGGGVSNVTSLVGGMGSAFGGVAALLAGGAIFNESIQAISSEASATKSLMNTLGMTSAAASDMRVQLDLVGISTDDYTGMAMKFDRQLKTNETSLNALGVATRGGNGELLDQETLLKNAANSMMDYKAGTDRNEVAMRLFGRTASEAFALVKLNDAVSVRATELSNAYGLALDDVSMKKVKDYKVAMNEVKLAGESVTAHLGEAVMPSLTGLANMFTSVAEEAVPVINNGLELVGTVFTGVSDVIQAGVKGVNQIFFSLKGVASAAFGVDMPADFLTWSTAMKVAGTAVAVVVSGAKVVIDSLVFSAQAGAIAFSTFAQMASPSNLIDPEKEVAIFKKGLSDIQAFHNTWSSNMDANAKTVESSMTKIWMSSDEVTKSVTKQGKSYTDTAAAQKDAKSAADDATTTYNKQVDAFNSLINSNKEADLALGKLSVSNMTVSQAEKNLSDATDTLNRIRKESHDLVMQGVKDGVDYKALQEKVREATKDETAAREAYNKVYNESTSISKSAQDAMRQSLSLTGELTGSELSIREATIAVDIARRQLTEDEALGDAGRVKIKEDTIALAAADNNLRVSHEALKLQTTDVSNATSDLSAAYTSLTGNSAPKLDKLSAAIKGMNGDLRTTIDVGIAAGNAIGGSFGDAVSKILTVLKAINSVCSALDSVSSLSNTAGQALGLVNGVSSASKIAGGASGASSLLGAGSLVGGSLGSSAADAAISGGTDAGAIAMATGSTDAAAATAGASLIGDLAIGGGIGGVSAAITGGDTTTGEVVGAGLSVLGNMVLPGIGGVIGGFLGGLFSDPRVKENISPVGITAHGLTLYDFSYKADPTHQMYEGVMSTDVRRVMPAAVSTYNGIDAVDYGMLGISMKKVPGYADGGYHSGGLRLVGETGMELEDTGPSRIFNHSDTMSMLDNSAVVEELREIKERLLPIMEMIGDQKVTADEIRDIFKRITQGKNSIMTRAAA